MEAALAQRQQKTSPPTPTLPPQLAAVNLHAAGIDIGAEGHCGAVPPSEAPQPVRGCGAYTAALEALADWLATCGLTTIAMAATGVSWMPLFALRETRGCAVLLVDPQQVPTSTGRPTSDVHDCQWIPRLHTFGLLAGAFRPDDQVCVRRRDLRHRARLLTSAAQHIQPMHKALTQRNITLQHGVSNMTGVTGLAILRAILAGERDPHTLAQLRDERCKHDEATSARALQGTWRDAPRLAWPKRWPSLTSITRKSPHALGTLRRISRRAPTAARGSRCPRHPAHASAAGINRRSPCGHPCTG